MPLLSTSENADGNAADSELAAKPGTARGPKFAWFDRAARSAASRRLSALQEGRLTLVDSLGTQSFGPQSTTGPHVTVRVSDPRFYRWLVTGGSLAGAEAYLAQFWSCDDLLALIRLLTRNADVLTGMDQGLARLSVAWRSLYNLWRRNSRRGSRHNIAAHYDLSNDFFRLFLDETMTYSSGVFESDEMTMQEASIAKYDRICRKLQLTPEDHVLEIGTGWGGFAIHAATHYGCRITTTTISREQYRLAAERVDRAGVRDRIRLLLQDYRELRGKFDKLVSIEMVEAVGHAYLPAFMKACADLLTPDGMFLLQAITIPDERYDGYRRSIDFIQRYIFPGGCLPSLSSIGRSLKGTDFRVFHLEDFGPHYAKTLERWRAKFWQNVDRIRQLGYSERFLRMWDYYFCYCQVGFLERQIGLAQILLTKPLCRRTPLLQID